MGLITLLLLAAVICVPLTQRLGLGAIPGYLAAGIAVGPSGLALETDVPAMMSVSEWGVVMMLFVIGLELAPRRLWEMRAEVFGAGLRHLAGMSVTVAVLCGLSLALSSTAVALRLLEERGVLRAPLGRMALGILLFQDMAAIPMLVAAGMLGSGDAEPPHFGVALVAVLVVLAGYRLRFLTWIRRSELRELFTAATLLIVLGAAQLFDAAGLSAGLGGFLMGVLLAESRYRADLEETIEPFKGLLLGLFFLAVGMSINLHEVYQYWHYVALGVVALLLIKGLLLYGMARLGGLPHYHRLMFALVLAQGGEFSYAIFAEAASNRLMTVVQRDVLSVIVAVSMGLIPCALKLAELLPARYGGIGGMRVRPAGFDEREDSSVR